VETKLATAQSIPDEYYGPEVGLVTFLDSQYPSEAPHEVCHPVFCPKLPYLYL
jgi:hypothetical protein